VAKHVQADWWEGEDREYAESVMGSLYQDRIERTSKEGPYLFLDVVFTDPKHQQRGAGSKLLKWGVDRADELGGEVFLEATPFGRHMYEQNGFQVTEYIIIPVPEKWADRPKVDHFFMRRPAMKKIL